MIDTTADTGATNTDPGNAKPEDGPAATTEQVTGSTQQTETKPEGGKPSEPQVPESYEFKMPDGVELDKAAADEFSALAKELKLDQATAQKAVDVAAKMAQRQVEQHAALVESWAEATKTDKEFGGDKLDENLAIARKAMDTFGTPALKELLNSTGLGNNPEVIRAFYKAGKAISEDGLVKGTEKVGDSDPAKKLFPSMT